MTQDPDTEPDERRPAIRVVVCDDSDAIRLHVRESLADRARIRVVGEAADGAACLNVVRTVLPDVVLMDVEMPRLGGVEATRRLVAELPELRVVALTGDDAAETVVAMIEAGARSYVLKGAPTGDLEQAIVGGERDAFLDRRIVPRVLDEVVRLFHHQRRLARELETLTHGVVRSLAGAVEARDGTTAGHVERVSRLALGLVRRASPELAADPQAEYGFLLHDLGKIGVPDAVLRKPGPLDEGELAQMRRHVEIGARLLEPMPGLDRAREVVLSHHERWDGRGYPRGLRRDEIPLAARLFAVCDAFDAITSDRPYRRALPAAYALEQLCACAGTQFDPDAARLFAELLRRGALDPLAAPPEAA